MSPQTKSFLILFSVAILGVLFCLMLWPDLSNIDQSPNNNIVSSQPVKPVLMPTEPAVDTSTWKTYTDKTYNFSFKYKPDWKVLPPIKKGGFTIIQIDPGKKYYNIKIYISPQEFYILDGLPAQSETISGATALNVNNALYGIAANNLYYTFDVGISMSLVPNFDALVHSVQFGLIIPSTSR